MNRQAVGGMVLLAALLGSGCGLAKDFRKDRHLKAAQSYSAEKKWKEATIEYRNALRYDPENLQAVKQLGLAYYENGQLGEAFPPLRRYRDQNPEDLEVRQKLGTIYLMGQAPDKARDVFADAVARGGPDFDIAPSAPMILIDDVEAGRDFLKPYYALYVGGMGSRGKNFYNDLMRRYGYEAEAEKIQELYLVGSKRDAAALVPDAFVDEVALVGPKERLAERLDAWRESGATSLLVSTQQPEAQNSLMMMQGFWQTPPELQPAHGQPGPGKADTVKLLAIARPGRAMLPAAAPSNAPVAIPATRPNTPRRLVLRASDSVARLNKVMPIVLWRTERRVVVIVAAAPAEAGGLTCERVTR